MTKTYFLTGANRGIGLSMAKQLAQDPNVKLIATARNPSGATELQDLAKTNAHVKVVQLDVSDENSIKKAVLEVAKLTDSIDVFVNNGAIGQAFSPVLKTPKEQWVNHYNTNVVGPILLLQQIYPLIKGDKKIIFISSLVGSLGTTLPISFSAYGQSKAALNYSIKDLGKEIGKEGYTVVAVHPGVVGTDMGQDAGRLLGEEDPSAGAFFESAEVLTPDQSAESLIDLFKGLTQESNGKFFSYDKSELPW
ncbi:hypothetical protein JA9_001153 [Meyerozyma sp. JA9]|nr:hypothetical protein JA9_001153 [Meyerozyma sp. JA9]